VTVHSGRWFPDDRAAAPYRYLPVDVPRGAEGLAVRLAYDRSAGVLDLGCFGPAGFRGWSGGARDGFVITAGAATPGYLPGELEAGTWQVVLGLHRVAPTGTAYEMQAHIGRFAVPDPPPPARAPAVRPARRALPADDESQWAAGDLHSHTVHSDGTLSVADLATLAASRGLDFLAVTDHNTVSHHTELPAAAARTGLVLLPGQELTTGDGHANCFGPTGWVDFRGSADDWLTSASSRGGLLSINHPLAGDCAWRRPMSGRPPLVEVWHSSWTWFPRSPAPLDWWRSYAPAAVPVGGSDWHRPGNDAPPGSPTTWVRCQAGQSDVDTVLAGLAAGRVALSASPSGPVLVPYDGALLAVDADGSVAVDGEGRRRAVRGDRVTLPSGPGPHRLVDDRGATLALVP